MSPSTTGVAIESQHLLVIPIHGSLRCAELDECQRAAVQMIRAADCDAYYGSAWGDDRWYDGGPIHVGPPAPQPPGARPPHVAHLPARPMPAPRPALRPAGRRR